MTPTLAYLLAILVIVFVIDFTLRALPFKILEPLRDPRFVSDLAASTPPRRPRNSRPPRAPGACKEGPAACSH